MSEEQAVPGEQFADVNVPVGRMTIRANKSDHPESGGERDNSGRT